MVILRMLTVCVVLSAMFCLVWEWSREVMPPQPIPPAATQLLPIPTTAMLEEIEALRAQQGAVLQGTSLESPAEHAHDFSTALASYAGVASEPQMLQQAEENYATTAQQLEIWADAADYTYNHTQAEKLRQAAAVLRDYIQPQAR